MVPLALPIGKGSGSRTGSTISRRSKVQWREAALSIYYRSQETIVEAESVGRFLALRRRMVHG